MSAPTWRDLNPKPAALLGLLVAAPIPPRIMVAAVAIVVLTWLCYAGLVAACTMQDRRRVVISKQRGE